MLAEWYQQRCAFLSTFLILPSCHLFYVLWLFLWVRSQPNSPHSLGQVLFQERDPNDTPSDASAYPVTAPVRIEGNVVGSDVDYYIVDLPTGMPDWSLFVYDSCSITSCSRVQPIVTVFFQDGTSQTVNTCYVCNVTCVILMWQTSWTGSGRIEIEVKLPSGSTGGGYGIVVSMSKKASQSHHFSS